MKSRGDCIEFLMCEDFCGDTMWVLNSEWHDQIILWVLNSEWHDQNIFAISIVNDLSFCKFVILSIIEGKKWDEEVQIWKFTKWVVSNIVCQ